MRLTSGISGMVGSGDTATESPRDKWLAYPSRATLRRYYQLLCNRRRKTRKYWCLFTLFALYATTPAVVSIIYSKTIDNDRSSWDSNAWWIRWCQLLAGKAQYAICDGISHYCQRVSGEATQLKRWGRWHCHFGRLDFNKGLVSDARIRRPNRFCYSVSAICVKFRRSTVLPPAAPTSVFTGDERTSSMREHLTFHQSPAPLCK